MDGFLRYEFAIGLEYDADLLEAMRLIKEELKKVKGILYEEKISSVVVSNLGTSSLEITVYYWFDTFDRAINVSQIKTEAVNRVLAVLDQVGFYLLGDVLEMKNFKGERLSVGENA